MDEVIQLVLILLLLRIYMIFWLDSDFEGAFHDEL
jgi:hypothetical protein